MIVYCEISTYIGTSVAWAEHWYGTLVVGGAGWSKKGLPDRLELKQTLTGTGAARMNRREGGDWEAGEETNKFFDEDRVKSVAIEKYKLLFPGATILVDGRHSVCDPQPLLDGPIDTVQTADLFVAEANDVGRWEGDEDAMREICDRWDDFWEGVKCLHSRSIETE